MGIPQGQLPPQEPLTCTAWTKGNGIFCGTIATWLGKFSCRCEHFMLEPVCTVHYQAAAKLAKAFWQCKKCERGGRYGDLPPDQLVEEPTAHRRSSIEEPVLVPAGLLARKYQHWCRLEVKWEPIEAVDAT